VAIEEIAVEAAEIEDGAEVETGAGEVETEGEEVIEEEVATEVAAVEDSTVAGDGEAGEVFHPGKQGGESH
jgi:hypothetical protein